MARALAAPAKGWHSAGHVASATVVLPAGGKGERMAAMAESRRVNKVALKAGKLTMIERTLGMYARAGVRRFVALVFHRAASVRRVLGDGRRWGVSIAYAVDPPRPVGKGGAIRIAIEKGVIPSGAPMIVHNPDDQIVAIDRRFPALIWAQHRACARRGALATAVCVPSTEYPYSTFTTRNGMATSAVMYPSIRIPTHTGITIVDPRAQTAFRRLIDLKRKTDFESVVLPALARRGRLGIAMIPAGTWIPVNDQKSYKKLLAAI